MNFEEFLKNDSDLLALVGTLKSNSFMESKFKIFFTKELFSKYMIDDNISRDDILILAEDVPVPYPEEDVVKLVESMGVLDQVSELNYKISNKINLSNFFIDASQYDLRTATNDYLQLWKRLEMDEAQTYFDLNDCTRSIKSTQKLSIQLIYNSIDERLSGIPVFIDCCGHNSHVFMNKNPGLETTADTFRVLLVPYLYDFQPKKEIKDIVEIMHNAIKNFQEDDDVWNRGGFYPGDEVPGSDYPLIDSSAIAIHTLALIWQITKNSFPDEFNEYSSKLSENILEGTKFLMRMQKSDGSWSIYCYENEKFPLETSFNSCQSVIKTLSFLKQTNMLGLNMTNEISISITKYINFISSTMKLKNEMFFWQERKLIKEEDSDAVIVSTLSVLDSLLTYSKLSKDERDRVSYILKGGMNYITDYFSKHNVEDKQINIIIPTNKGLRNINCGFNIPIRTRYISLLLDYSNLNQSLLGIKFQTEIKKDIFNMIRTQVHGHWAHPLDARPSIPFTYSNYETLLKYTASQINNAQNI